MSVDPDQPTQYLKFCGIMMKLGLKGYLYNLQACDNGMIVFANDSANLPDCFDQTMVESKY